MAKGTKGVARRFQPYVTEAENQTGIRYGAQEAGLASIFDQRTRDYTRDAAAQQTAYRSLLGSLRAAPADLTRAYSDAGLTPAMLAQIGESPTGQRLAGELARAQTGLQGQLLGAESGNQYQQSKLSSEYGDDVRQINSQAQALQKEKGLFQQSLLNQLITDDRTRRHAANELARKQEYDARQAQLGRDAALNNALIGQGLLPDAEGNLTPLPGGKADPNAPANQPKAPKPSKPTGADRSIQGDYRQASSWIKQLDAANLKTFPDEAKRREVVQEILLKGDQASGIPSITSAGLDVALDIFYDKAVSSATVQALHDAGAKLKFLGKNIKTEAQRDAEGRRNARRGKVTRPTQAVPGFGPLG